MWHPVQEQKDPVSPSQFKELKVEQKQKQDLFIQQAIKRANSCLLEIAGGDLPSPFNGKFVGSGGDYLALYQEYVAWLNQEYAQEHLNLVPGMLHLELCRLDAVDPPDVYEQLRQRFIDAGWGEETRVHKRAGPDNMVWVSLMPVEEKGFPLTVKQVERLDASRVLHWIKELKVPVQIPLNHYTDKDRRQILKDFVADHWRCIPSKAPEKKTDPYPDIDDVPTLSRKQLTTWLKTLNVSTPLSFDRCSEKRLRRMLTEALLKLDEEEEE